MGWFSKLIGMNKGLDVLDNNLGRVSTAIDKFTFTDQEKSEATMTGLKLQLEFIKTQQSENSIRSVTRRALAVMLFITYLGLIICAVIAWPRSKEYADFIFSVVAKLSSLVLMVFGFYFGYYALSNIIGKAKEKKEG